MTIENPQHTLSPAQRERLQQASQPIGDVPATRTELAATVDRIAALDTRRQAAHRQYQEDAALPDAPFITDEMREAARTGAEKLLTQTEVAIRREVAILGRRAQSIAAQLQHVADTPSLASLDPDVLATASQMIPIVAAQLPSLSLALVAQRLRAAQVRGDQGEIFAYATATHAHLAERQETPKTNDTDTDFFATRDIVQAMQAGFRDTSLDPLLTQARDTVVVVGSFDRQIIADKQERGDRDPYGFLEGAA